MMKISTLEWLDTVPGSHFLIGAMATALTLYILYSVLPPFSYMWIPVFALSGVPGGLITGDPRKGSITGLIGGCIPYLLYFTNGTKPLHPCLLFLLGGYIGGMIRMKLLRRGKEQTMPHV